MEKNYKAPKSEWISFDVADVVTDEIGLPDLEGGAGDSELSIPGGWGGWGDDEDDDE